MPAGGCSGDLKPFVSTGFGRPGRPLLAFFSWGAFTGDSWFRDERVAWVGWDSDSVFAAFAVPLVGLLVGSSAVVALVDIALAPASSPARFFCGRPLRGVAFGGAFSTSDCGFSGTGSIDDLAFFGGTREN